MTALAMTWLEFSSAEQLVAAAVALRERGVRRLDAYTPFEVPELTPLLGAKRPVLLPSLVLAGAVLGGCSAFLVIWWTAAVDYPLNVGGRPLNSLPADIPIVFESSVLFAALSAFFAVLGFSGMPRLNHPLETLPGFARTSDDRYWLGLDASEAGPDSERLLRQIGALRVHQPKVSI